jgi:WD40 repeat protein
MRDRDKLLLDALKPEQQVEFARMKGSDFDSSGFLPCLRLKDRELEIWNVSFSPDGKRFADGKQLATASADGTVKLWIANDGRAIASLPPHEKAARCVAFNHDSSLVVSAGEDGIVRIASQQNSSATTDLEGKNSSILQ